MLDKAAQKGVRDMRDGRFAYLAVLVIFVLGVGLVLPVVALGGEPVEGAEVFLETHPNGEDVCGYYYEDAKGNRIWVETP